MENEIIDLTDSPTSPPRSSIAPSSTRQIQFQNAPIPLSVNTNPNLSQRNQQQTAIRTVPRHTYDPSQIVTRFQRSNMQGVTILEPISESNRHLVPRGVWHHETWTQREHELFVMGLIIHGKGHWDKIARDFVCNKTPQQVQSYAASFLRNLSPPPPTYRHGFSRRNPTYSGPYYLVSTTWNLMVGLSASYSIPMIVNQSQQLVMTPISKNTSFILAPSYEEASSSTNTIMYESQMHTGVATARTSMNVIASANEEIDLELRLGRGP